MSWHFNHLLLFISYIYFFKCRHSNIYSLARCNREIPGVQNKVLCGGCISLSNAEGCIRSFFPVYSSFCSDKCLKSYKNILFPKLTALYDEIFQNWHHFMTPLFNHAVAFCHHFSSITFPSSFYSGSMPSDYYDILSNCRRIVPSLFISAVVLYRHALQYLQAKK